MQNRYVLILVSLNPDRTDLSGNKFPNSGYVQARRFKSDENIENGLYGTLWGKYKEERWLNTDSQACWLVVKSEFNDDVIPLVNRENFYKFRSGMVVYSGDRLSPDSALRIVTRST